MTKTADRPLTPGQREALISAAERYADIRGRLLALRGEADENYCRRVHGVEGSTRASLVKRGLFVFLPGERFGEVHCTLTAEGYGWAIELYDDDHGSGAFNALLSAKLAESQTEEDELNARREDAATRAEVLRPLLEGLEPTAPGLGSYAKGKDLADVAVERFAGADARYSDQALPVTLSTIEAIVRRAQQVVADGIREALEGSDDPHGQVGGCLDVMEAYDSER